MLQTRAPNEAEIPTSSMADIAFLLIIFFMLTLTFAVNRGMDFRIPKDESAIVVEPIDSILIRIDAASNWQVDNQPVQVEGLLAYLGEKLGQNPSKPVILLPDRQAPYGSMIEVYDLLKGAKDKLSLERDVVISIPTAREAEMYFNLS